MYEKHAEYFYTCILAENCFLRKNFRGECHRPHKNIIKALDSFSGKIYIQFGTYEPSEDGGSSWDPIDYN